MKHKKKDQAIQEVCITDNLKFDLNYMVFNDLLECISDNKDYIKSCNKKHKKNKNK